MFNFGKNKKKYNDFAPPTSDTEVSAEGDPQSTPPFEVATPWAADPLGVKELPFVGDFKSLWVYGRPAKQTPQEMVQEFLQAFKRPLKTDGPGWNEDVTLEEMRFGLIAEEFAELLDALFEPGAGDPVRLAWENEINAGGIYQDNTDTLVEVVDALADLVYVIYGAAEVIGVDLDDCIREVHRSNLTKLDENGEPLLREDGKILKSDLYEEPNLRKVIYGE